MKPDRKANLPKPYRAASEDEDSGESRQVQQPAYRIQQVRPTKSDDEILRRYEELMGEKHPEPLSPVTQSPPPHQIQPKQFMPDSLLAAPASKSPPNRLVDAPLDRIQQLPSREAEAPPSRTNRVYSRDALDEKKLPTRNIAPKPPTGSGQQLQRKMNELPQYEQGKPFSSKLPASKKTIDEPKVQRDEPVSNKLPSKSSQNDKKPSTTSTAQNFKRKLEENMVKDKEQGKATADRKAARNSSKPLSTGKAFDEKVLKQTTQRIRDELLDLNYEQTLLQAQLRKMHMDNKERTAQFYKKHSIRSGVTSIKELIGQDMLVLDEPEETSTPASQKNQSKRLKLLNEYQEYIDEINLELRKVNHLLKSKTGQLALRQEHMENNLLYTMIVEAINREESSQANDSQLNNISGEYGKQEDLPKGKENEEQAEQPQFTSYKELMRYRKNKAWQRSQRMNFDSGRTATQFEPSPAAPTEKVAPVQIETYEIDGVGKLKVNPNLKNLLLN